MDFIIFFTLTCSIVFLVFAKHYVEKKIIFEIDKAFEDLNNWRLANPYLAIGDIPYARNLVLVRISFYKRLMKVFPFVKVEEHIKILQILLEEYTDPPPHRSKLTTIKPERLRVLFILEECSFQKILIHQFLLILQMDDFCHHEVVLQLYTKESKLPKRQ